MSTTNDALLKTLRNIDYPVRDLEPGAASTQGTAAPILGVVTRVKFPIASGSLILRSLLSEEMPLKPHFVINDTVGAILVYPFTGETQNGSLNASLSIAAGDFAIFLPVRNAAGVVDWRSSVVA